MVTKEQFARVLTQQPLDDVVQKYVFTGLPFAFRRHPKLYDRLLLHVSTRLGVPKKDITLVGSGRLGFSLHTNIFGQPFSRTSDLDVLVVSDRWFDRGWLQLRRLPRLDYAKLKRRVKTWVDRHRRFSVYQGWLWPRELAGAIRMSRPWTSAFQSLSRDPDFAARRVSGRLYRTWEHASTYHVYGLTTLLNSLRKDEGR